MENNTEDLSWLWQKRFLKRVSLGSLASAILVYILTLPAMIKPLHESEVIFYVPLTILSQQLNQQGIGFGGDREIDWYIQILKSNQLADSLIKKFDLFSYFNMESSGLDSKNQMYRKMESRITINKTQYGSVSIKVLDADPKRAADMANEIIVLGEAIKSNLLSPNRLESMRYVTSLYSQKETEVAHIEKSLDSLLNTPHGIKKDYLYNKTLTLYNLEIQELITRKGIFEREQKNFTTPLPMAYIISSAVPISETVWPKRRLLMGAAAAFYLLILVVFEIIRRDNRKIK